MFYLKRFNNFKYFLVTWLHSPSASPLENYPQPSPLEAARTAAIARLIFRDIYIHISGWQYLQVWLMAGCNRFVHAGAGVHKHLKGSPTVIPGHGQAGVVGAEVENLNESLKLINLLPLTTRYIFELGLEIEPSIQAIESKRN